MAREPEVIAATDNESGGRAMEVRIKGLVKDTDRHGNVRFYLRVPGRPKVRLREPFGSDTFHEEVRCARLGIPYHDDPRREGKPDPTAQPGTLKWLCLEYLHRGCVNIAATTRTMKQNALESICATPLEGKTSNYGQMPYAYFAEQDIEYLRDLKAYAPNAANYRIKQLSCVFSWAMETRGRDGAKLATRNPARDVKHIRIVTTGYHTWTANDIERYLARHPIGTQANLAFRLFFFTGARVCDVARLGRQNLYTRTVLDDEGNQVEECRLRFRPKKTSNVANAVEVDMLVTPELAETIDALPKNQMIFLQNIRGRGYTDGSLSNMVKDWTAQAGIAHCSAHGIRKAYSTMLAEGGATDRQLMALLGWKSEKMANIYTRSAERRRLADEGSKALGTKHRLDRIVNDFVPPDKTSKKVG